MSGEQDPSTTGSSGTHAASTTISWQQIPDAPFEPSLPSNPMEQLRGSFASPQPGFLPPIGNAPMTGGANQLLGLEELTHGSHQQLAQSLPPMFSLPMGTERQLDMHLDAGGESVLDYGQLVRDTAPGRLHSPMPQPLPWSCTVTPSLPRPPSSSLTIRLGYRDMEALLRAKQGSAEDLPELLARLPALAETRNLLPASVATRSGAGDTWSPSVAGVAIHGAGAPPAEMQALNLPSDPRPDPPEVRDRSGVKARTGVGGSQILLRFGEPIATSHMSPHESSASSDTSLRSDIHETLLRSPWSVGGAPQEDLAWAAANAPTLAAGATLSSLPRSPSLLPLLPPGTQLQQPPHPPQPPPDPQLSPPGASVHMGLWDDLFGTRSSLAVTEPHPNLAAESAMSTDPPQFKLIAKSPGGGGGVSPLKALPRLSTPLPPSSMSLGLSSFGGPLKNWESVGGASVGGGMAVSPRASYAGEKVLISPRRASSEGGGGGGEGPGEELLPPPAMLGEDWEGGGTPGKRKLSGGAGLTKLDAGHTVIKRKVLSSDWEGSSPRMQSSPSSLQSPQLRPRSITPAPSSPSLSGGTASQSLPPPQVFSHSGPQPSPWPYPGTPTAAPLTGQMGSLAMPTSIAMRQRHVAMDTRSVKERQRRVNVKEGMRQLQDLLPERDSLMDKVTLLSKAVAYIKELQEKVRTYEAREGNAPDEPSPPREDANRPKSPSSPADTP